MASLAPAQPHRAGQPVWCDLLHTQHEVLALADDERRLPPDDGPPALYAGDVAEAAVGQNHCLSAPSPLARQDPGPDAGSFGKRRVVPASHGHSRGGIGYHDSLPRIGYEFVVVVECHLPLCALGFRPRPTGRVFWFSFDFYFACKCLAVRLWLTRYRPCGMGRRDKKWPSRLRLGSRRAANSSPASLPGLRAA